MLASVARATVSKMEAEAVKTVLYLLLVLGGGVMVGVLAVLLIIAIATFGAWLVILSRRLRAAACAGLGNMSRDHGRK